MSITTVKAEDSWKYPDTDTSSQAKSTSKSTSKKEGSEANKSSAMYLPCIKPGIGGNIMSNAFLKWKDVGDGEERTIYFQTIPDSGFSFSKNANYESIEIPGRNEPIKNWTGSGEKKIPLSLTYVAVGKHSDFSPNFLKSNSVKAFTTITDNGYAQLLANMRMLESLVYGGKNGEAPPKVHLRFGVFFSTKTTVPCIVESVSVQVGSPGPFAIESYIPKMVTIELDLTVQYDLDEVPHYEAILKDTDIAGGKDKNISTFRYEQIGSLQDTVLSAAEFGVARDQANSLYEESGATVAEIIQLIPGLNKSSNAKETKKESATAFYGGGGSSQNPSIIGLQPSLGGLIS